MTRSHAAPVHPIVAKPAEVVLLVGPTVLAFFAGGYFAGPRRVAIIVAWTLVVAIAAASRGPRGWTRPRPYALAGLGLLVAWTFLSATWAPVQAHPIPYGEIGLLYLGTLMAATAVMRNVRNAVEPTLAAGTVLVVVYGLSERFLPGALHFGHTSFSLGRLEQPLTYWNAEAELAAIGLVLCARIAGDAVRGRELRMAAAAGCCPLGAGLYLCVSRGALLAVGVGLLTLVLLAPQREQLVAAVVCTATAVVAALAANPISERRWLEGSLASRERTGLLVLLMLAAIGGGAAFAAAGVIIRGRTGSLGLSARTRMIPLMLVVVALIASITIGTASGSLGRVPTGADRLTTTNSIRYAYWRVALDAFAAEPLRGVGAGGWTIWWRHEAPREPAAQDAHSLPLQTLAELGLVGAGLLTLFLGGVALAARDGLRRDPRAFAGPIAGCVVYLAHAPLDWDWEMPAVTLVAIILAGVVLAGDVEADPRRGRSARHPPGGSEPWEDSLRDDAFASA